MDNLARAASETVLALLARRASGATICPSEVARALADAAAPSGAGWRDLMPIVHGAIDQLLDDDIVSLSWKGKPLATRTGPYRIAHAPDPRGSEVTPPAADIEARAKP
jgi:hypothetical protein